MRLNVCNLCKADQFKVAFSNSVHLNQPEAAKADKVSVCRVRPPHDWLFGKDELARQDVSGGHHVPPKPLVPLDPPEAGGRQITS